MANPQAFLEMSLGKLFHLRPNGRDLVTPDLFDGWTQAFEYQRVTPLKRGAHPRVGTVSRNKFKIVRDCILLF
jgi:hypothetical protein